MAGLLDRSTSRRAFRLGDAGPVGVARAAEAGRLRQSAHERVTDAEEGTP